MPNEPRGSIMQVINDDQGIDTADQWEQYWEGKDYDCAISVIHVSTTEEGFGPHRHYHPYPEVMIVRRGYSTVYVGDEAFTGDAGQTVVIPANTPHSFVAHGSESNRYESIAIHNSPVFVHTDTDDDQR